ncbi:MAG: hypothetical protein F6K55_17870 [Moorea sp. SIO4A3]|nr:hypothetical protein [Moorena sp. SIO4A3]
MIRCVRTIVNPNGHRQQQGRGGKHHSVGGVDTTVNPNATVNPNGMLGTSRYAPEAFGQRPTLRERKAWPLASASALMRSHRPISFLLFPLLPTP